MMFKAKFNQKNTPRSATNKPHLQNRAKKRPLKPLLSFEDTVVVLFNKPFDVLTQLFKHIEDLHQFYGEEKGYRIARKHVGWYTEKLNPESNFKRTFNTLSSTKEQLYALEDFVKSIHLES